MARQLYFGGGGGGGGAKWQYINVYNTIHHYMSEAYGNEAIKSVIAENVQKYMLQILQCLSF